MNKKHWWWIVPVACFLLFCCFSAFMIFIDDEYENRIHRDLVQVRLSELTEGLEYPSTEWDDAFDRYMAEYHMAIDALPLRLKVEHRLWQVWIPIVLHLRLIELWFYLTYHFR
ncbi:MAG: hypothetical protein OXN17_18850 [Candidatus Poribacteria bacterium]|nr:hypothetical protein [Candidatus Poribacteria bacterium]